MSVSLLPALIGTGIFALGGCVEYDHLRPGGLETDETPPIEACDGVDNTGDGLVDEGYRDFDGDSIADCLQCAIEPRDAEYVFDVSGCDPDLIASADPWKIVEVWRFDVDYGCRLGPVVDLDGDGRPDPICVSRDVTYALSGLDGRLLWTFDGFDDESPATAADLDGEGSMEVVGIAPGGEVVAASGDGERIWTGAEIGPEGPSGTGTYRWSVRVADLHGDGRAEVVTPRGAVDGWHGTDRARIGSARARAQGPQEIAIADVDFDGDQDVFVQGLRATPDGKTAWELSSVVLADRSVQPLLVQADDDVEAEILWVAEDVVVLVEPDGTEIWRREAGDAGPALTLACAGDLDADGRMDVVFADRDRLRAWDLNGVEKWTLPVTDPFTYTACTVFDFDFDGAEEILYSDELSFYVLDGRTGEPVLQVDHRSNTYGDIPVTVDLDGDGSIEIVVPSTGGGGFGAPGIVVYTNPAADWPPGAPIWPSEDWSGTTLYLDGTVPRRPPPAWLRYGTWRGQPEYILDSVDLRPELEHCEANSEADLAEIRLAVRIANLGPQYVVAGTPMAVYLLDDAGTRQLHSVVRAPDFLDAGQATPTTEIVLDRAQAHRGVILVAGDDGTASGLVDDCDPSNDSLEWRLE